MNYLTRKILRNFGKEVVRSASVLLLRHSNQKLDIIRPWIDGAISEENMNALDYAVVLQVCFFF